MGPAQLGLNPLTLAEGVIIVSIIRSVKDYFSSLMTIEKYRTSENNPEVYSTEWENKAHD